MGACTNTQEMNWDYLYKNNFIFTKKLIEFSAVNNIKLIYASSASIYGKDSGNINEIKDSNSFKPLNYYAKSKFILDKFVEKNIKKNIPLVGLRYFNVYGPREPVKGTYAPVVGLFKRQKQNRNPITIVGDGLQRRDFTYISDVVDANIAAMETATRYGIYNVGTGKNYSMIDLVNLIDPGNTLPVNFIPSRPAEVKETLADISRTTKDLGWTPKFNLEEKINDY